MIIELSVKNIEQILEKEPNFEIERLVIGYFDGIHNGHLKLFEEDLAKTSVITFINHPNKSQQLYNDEERTNQLDQIGVKNIYVYDLKQNLSANDFCTKFIKKLNPKKIVVGEDFHFGCNQENADFLAKFFQVEQVPKYNGISTSKIKNLIINAEFQAANEMLVFPYYRTGIVQKGKGIATTILKTSTANIDLDDELINIPPGVYITKTVLFDKKYKSVTFVGSSKTFDKTSERHSRIETHLLNYNGEDFHNEEIKIHFYKKIADVKKYVFKISLIRKINKYKKMAENFYWLKSMK